MAQLKVMIMPWWFLKHRELVAQHLLRNKNEISIAFSGWTKINYQQFKKRKEENWSSAKERVGKIKGVTVHPFSEGLHTFLLLRNFLDSWPAPSPRQTSGIFHFCHLLHGYVLLWSSPEAPNFLTKNNQTITKKKKKHVHFLFRVNKFKNNKEGTAGFLREKALSPGPVTSGQIANDTLSGVKAQEGEWAVESRSGWCAVPSCEVCKEHRVWGAHGVGSHRWHCRCPSVVNARAEACPRKMVGGDTGRKSTRRKEVMSPYPQQHAPHNSQHCQGRSPIPQGTRDT